MKEISFWHCYECDEEVCAENVTFEETHDRCGEPVEWLTINVPETSDEDEVLGDDFNG